ncbi:putative reverse transcriptase domain, reverse transcriptase zinc-binding domain protein [Tanacetum coccineum]
MDSNGVCFQGEAVPPLFVAYYLRFLGKPGNTTLLNDLNLFTNVLSNEQALDMVRLVSIEEVKGAIFDMGLDVVKAVREFFSSGKILKELNHTTIALIPKVSINQLAFIPGRRISDNILLTQELMHNYHLDRGPPRCAFKVDIQKAYDTMDWLFLKSILIGFGFHMTMVEWIMECVSSTSFSLNINGVLHGYFKGKRGLRQGDPLSPYLFTLVMEVLTLMLKRHVRDSNEFTFHKKCADLGIVNLCFTDDLFLFAYGDVNSASVIMFALEEFKNASGLVPSLPKSTAYFCNVLNHVKLAILNVMPFEEGSLPVKYLGLPLVSSRLVYRDCKELVVKVQDRIGDWKKKFLSFVGRLQLTQSVISSMHIYWASMFILPSLIMSDIEQLMRGFLWCQGPMKRGKDKV